MLTREEALALVHEYTSSESLRKHMLAVEVAMQAYAERLGGDPGTWGIAGLLHDFDYERWPNETHEPDREHPAEGVRILRERGVQEEILQAILGHADYTGVPRTTPMARALFAVDELTGLITATALVRPGRNLNEVDVRSVKKKMKDKAFARGVNRDDITRGASDLGVDLDGHIQVVLDAMRGIAGELGLAGASTT